MVRLTAALVLALSTATAGAETPLSAEAFEDYVMGKTLQYATPSGPYGVEQYLRNRRVRWSYLGGECTEGFWYPEGSQICFVYETIPTPQCWSFFLTDRGLGARFENDPDNLTVYETTETDEPLICPGPRVGA